MLRGFAVEVLVVAAVAAAADFAAPAADVDGPPLPPRIVDRSSLEKLELSMETSPPSKPVAPAALVGSCACCRILTLVHNPLSLRAITKRSCWTFPLIVPLLTLH